MMTVPGESVASMSDAAMAVQTWVVAAVSAATRHQPVRERTNDGNAML